MARGRGVQRERVGKEAKERDYFRRGRIAARALPPLGRVFARLCPSPPLAGVSGS
jgi:hypothetical protein